MVSTLTAERRAMRLCTTFTPATHALRALRTKKTFACWTPIILAAEAPATNTPAPHSSRALISAKVFAHQTPTSPVVEQTFHGRMTTHAVKHSPMTTESSCWRVNNNNTTIKQQHDNTKRHKDNSINSNSNNGNAVTA